MNRIHLLLDCMVATGVLCTVVVGQVQAPGSDKRHPDRSALSYPDRIAFPSDLVATDITRDKDDELVICFPISDYSVFHYDGWQLYLERFGLKNEAIDLKWKAPLIPTAGVQFRAMEDGFEACKRAAQDASQVVSIELLRNDAKRAFFPRIPLTPPKSREKASPAILFPSNTKR
jgi:hypothetical protein